MTAPSKDQQVGVMDISQSVEDDEQVCINEDESVKRTAGWTVGARLSRQGLRVETGPGPIPAIKQRQCNTDRMMVLPCDV
jgi:hypothetical protein